MSGVNIIFVKKSVMSKMLPAFIVNYVTGRQQITKVKVDRVLSLAFFAGGKVVRKEIKR